MGKYYIEKEFYNCFLDIVRVYKEDENGKVSFVGKVITSSIATDKNILSFFGIERKEGK